MYWLHAPKNCHDYLRFNIRKSISLTAVAEKRIRVLLMSLVVVITLSAGSYFLKVTTNPVELWSGQNSRCRLEKEFFDTNFGPFYRTQQVFIKTKGIKPVSVCKFCSIYLEIFPLTLILYVIFISVCV